MSTAATNQVLLRTVGSLLLRIKAVENQVYKGMSIPEMKMDEKTQKIFDELKAAIGAQTDDAPAAPKSAKVEKVSEPTISETAAPTISAKYLEMSKEDCLRRVRMRGGDAAEIMQGYHARARTIALRQWLTVNPPAKKPKLPTINKGKIAKAVATRRAAH